MRPRTGRTGLPVTVRNGGISFGRSGRLFGRMASGPALAWLRVGSTQLRREQPEAFGLRAGVWVRGFGVNRGPLENGLR